jgi:hypothetical protein
VIRCNSNPIHLKRAGRKREEEEEEEEEMSIL